MINDKGVDTGASNTMASAMADAQNRGQAQQSGMGQETERKMSLSNLSSILKMPIGRNPASEILTKLEAAFKEKFTDLGEGAKLHLMAIDEANTPEISFSVLVVGISIANLQNSPLAYHVLILEGSIPQIPTLNESIRGQQVEIIRVIGDGNNARLNNAVRAELVRRFGNRTLLNADSCVVPRGFNVTDQDAFYRLAVNAITACWTELKTRAEGFSDLDLSKVSKDSSLVVSTKFDAPQTTDALGNPVRSDIEIVFSAVTQNRGAVGNQDLHAALEENAVLSKATGYIDLVWDEMPGANNAFNMYQPQAQQQMTQKYMGRLVLTSLATEGLMTIPAQLMALVAALSLRQGNAWFNAFRPRTFVGGTIDLRDIGAIGYEVGANDASGRVYDRFNTKSDTFRPEQLGQMLAAFFKPGLIISIDVPECGDSTWNLAPFAACAAGKPAAYEAIYAAANKLTGGIFAKYFKKGDPICIDEGNRIHMGYYVDNTGVKRDLRDIDHLAVLNLTGASDREAARAWSDTFQRTEYELPLRLHHRFRTITALRVDPVVTGYFRRPTFAAGFLEALLASVFECGLAIRQANSQEMVEHERASYGFTGTLLAAGNSNVFSAGFGQTNSFGTNNNFGIRF